jgi:hypothetical protein
LLSAVGACHGNHFGRCPNMRHIARRMRCRQLGGGGVVRGIDAPNSNSDGASLSPNFVDRCFRASENSNG